MEDVIPATYGCTAGDVQIEFIEIDSVNGDTTGPFECTEGETLLVSFTAFLATNSNRERYDVGIWLDGTGLKTDARTGGPEDCTHVYFNPSGTESLPDLELPEAFDTCGDIDRNNGVPYEALIEDVAIQCEDPTCTPPGCTTEGANVKVGYCIGYKTPGTQNQVCDDVLDPGTGATSYAAATVPGTSSKCTCTLVDFDITIERCDLTANCIQGDAAPDCVGDVPDPVIPDGGTTEDPDLINQVFSITSDPTCEGLQMTMVESDNGGEGCANDPLVFTRVYTLSDNTPRTDDVVCNRTVTVARDQAPVFDHVPDGQDGVECPDCTDFSCHGVATAKDFCDVELPVSQVDTTVLDSSCSPDTLAGTYTRTFTATDSCDVEITATQVITVEDNTDPVFTSFPPDSNNECPLCIDGLGGANETCFGEPEAEDLCGPVTLDSADSKTDGCNSLIGDFIRTWTATDACFRTKIQAQTVTVVDTQPPVISGCPESDTASCEGDILAPEAPEAEDACLGEGVLFACCLTGNDITRTWTFTDECGNSDQCDQATTITCVPPVVPPVG